MVRAPSSPSSVPERPRGEGELRPDLPDAELPLVRHEDAQTAECCHDSSMSSGASRRAARATWEVTILRNTDPDTSTDGNDDDLYWLRVPRDERARLTWDLSRELYSLAARNGGVVDDETGSYLDIGQDDLERRLPRSALGITRR